jgi:hypothetical protein
MISVRTKALLFLASLPFLVCIGIVTWLALEPYYAHLIGKNYSRSIAFSFHFTPWLWIWVITLLAGLISFLYDRRVIRKP